MKCFPSPLWEKRGFRTCWYPTKHWKGADGRWCWGGHGGVHFLSFIPFPRTPYSTPPPSVRWELRKVCICGYGKCWGGVSYWRRAEWNLAYCLPSCTLSPSSFLLGQRIPWMPGVSCSVKYPNDRWNGARAREEEEKGRWKLTVLFVFRYFYVFMYIWDLCVLHLSNQSLHI